MTHTTYLRVSLVNVFKGILDNNLFCGILLTTAVLQVFIVQFGSVAFKVAEDGLSAKYWGLSMLLGAGSLPVQQVINVVYRLFQNYNIHRNKKRSAKTGQLTTKRADGSACEIPEVGHAHKE